jgi:hypothetical protein
MESAGLYQTVLLDRTRTFHAIFIRKKNVNEN